MRIVVINHCQRLDGVMQGGRWAPRVLGRRRYEDMLSTWNARGGPFKDGLNAAAKYVASSNPATQLEWPDSTLLHGDVPAAVAELKQRPGGDLVIMGIGRLIRSLLPYALVDEYLLMIHPLLLGSGQRLFDRDDRISRLRLLSSVATDTGVIIAAYQSAIADVVELPSRAVTFSERSPEMMAS